MSHIDYLVINDSADNLEESNLVISVNIKCLDNPKLKELSGRKLIVACIIDDNHVPAIREIASRFGEISCLSDKTISKLHNDLQEKILETHVVWEPSMQVRESSRLIYMVSNGNLHDFPFSTTPRITIHPFVNHQLVMCVMAPFSYKSVSTKLSFDNFWIIKDTKIKRATILQPDTETIVAILKNCNWSEVHFKKVSDIDVDADIELSPSIIGLKPDKLALMFASQLRNNQINMANRRFARVKAIC